TFGSNWVTQQYQSDITRLKGFTDQMHHCFVWRMRPLFLITPFASRNQIVPTMSPTPATRDDMIYRQVVAARRVATVLTNMQIAQHDRHASRWDAPMGQFHIMYKPNHQGNR